MLEDAGGEEFCGGVEVDAVVAFLSFEDEVAEFRFLAGDDAPADFIVCGAVGKGEVFREKFLKPFRVNSGGTAEVGDDLAGLDLGDFGGDEGGGVPDAGVLVELALAVADESAGEGALALADGELVAEGGEHGLADCDAVCLEVDGIPLPAEALGHGAEAVEALGDLACAAGHHTDLVAAAGIELHGDGGVEGAPFAGEVRVII